MALRRCIGPAGIAAVIRRAAAPSAPPSSAAELQQLRLYAVPVQPKPKADSRENSKVPRLNTAITAPVVRLVTDDGHSVISRTEALQLANRMNLDLVEVQGFADPPVCKLMDFHKEKYKKETKEKERAKEKSAVSLRAGDCKEVRFKGKTETNDLKVKADGVIKLMEKGYRVKCIAKGSEGDNLEDLLSRLLALIEDASFVESGPHFESKQAYVIVRHSKFKTKKSGKKVNKESDEGRVLRTDSSVSADSMHEDHELEVAGSNSEVRDSEFCNPKGNSKKFQSLSADPRRETQTKSDKFHRHRMDSHLAEVVNNHINKSVSPDLEKAAALKPEPVAESNRYAARSDPRTRLNQPNESNFRERTRHQPMFSNEQRMIRGLQSQTESSSETQSQFRQPHFNNSHAPSQSHGRPGLNQLRQPQFSNMGRPSFPGKVFENLNAPNHISSQGAQGLQRGPSCPPVNQDSPSKGFRLFSSPKDVASLNENNSGSRTTNESGNRNPTPTFGIFSSKRP